MVSGKVKAWLPGYDAVGMTHEADPARTSAQGLQEELKECWISMTGWARPAFLPAPA
jgi:hypothetical protein